METAVENPKNHSRITVTSRKTGATEVLLETRRDRPDFTEPLRGQFVLAGIPIVESIDDSLDTLTFTVRESPTRKLYRPFDIVRFTVQSGGKEISYDMCILSDSARMLSRMNRNYEHTVLCVEMTKLLEKVKIFNLNLTNPHDSLLRQLEKAVNNADPPVTVDGTVRHRNRFSVSDELRRLLEGVPGEDFRFGNTDLRTVLDSILSKVNCRACVSEIGFENGNIRKIVIGYRSMTATREIVPVWDRAHHGEIVGEEFSVHGQDVAGEIVSRGYNTLADAPLTFTSVFKSASRSMNDSNVCAMLPFPISEKGIKSFVMNVRFRMYQSGNVDYDGPMEYPVDISSRIIPYEQYELLPDEDSDKIRNEDKKHYLPFHIGSQEIGAGLYKESLLFGIITWTNSVMENVLVACGNEQAPKGYKVSGIWQTTNFMGVGPWGKFYDHPFTITYYPQVDTADVISKPNTYDEDDLFLGLQDSQSENTLNMERHGRRLQSLIKRTGNDEYFLDVQADSFSTLLPLMAKIDLPADGEGHTDDDYVLYKRECGVYDGFVKCRYYFSKDYNAVQEAAGVRREKHLYDIPLESDECPIVLKRYIVFGFDEGVSTGDYYAEFVGSALRTLTGQNEGRTYIIYQQAEDGTLNSLMDVSMGKVNFMLLKTFEANAQFPDSEHVFLLPCLTYGQGTTMNFVARTLDNYSVDYRRDGYEFSIWGDAGNVITYARYVSDAAGTAGECDGFLFNLAFEWGVITPYTNQESAYYKDALNDLPVVKDQYFATCLSDSAVVHFYKDRTQRPLFCHIVECVPRAADYGNLIIGTAFCRDNNLVRENGEGLKGLKLVVSHDVTIDDDDDFLPEGFGGNFSVADYFEVISGALPAKLRYKGGLEAGITAWAIVNEIGEIYIAANGGPRTVYAWVMDTPA